MKMQEMEKVILGEKFLIMSHSLLSFVLVSSDIVPFCGIMPTYKLYVCVDWKWNICNLLKTLPWILGWVKKDNTNGASHFLAGAIHTKIMSGVWALTDLTGQEDILYKNEVLTNEKASCLGAGFPLVKT